MGTSFVLVMFTNLMLVKLSLTDAIFQISLPDLDSAVTSGQYSILESVMSSSGCIAVTNMPKDFTMAVRNIKRSAPACLQQENYPQFYLPDGSQRRTFASVSNEATEYPECIREDSEIVGKYLDTVDGLMSRLVTNIAGPENLLWRTEEDQGMNNFSTTLYKEHIHVYEPLDEKTHMSEYAAPFHTDNGLLLIITPFQEHPLQVKNKAGNIVETGEIGDDSLLVLVASALPKWLLKGTDSSHKFFPVPHAVPSLANQGSPRTVFARMKIVPLDAFPSSNEKAIANYQENLFEDFFNNIKHPGLDEICPITRDSHQLAVGDSWSSLKQQQCDESTAYCWMDCLEIPTSCVMDSTLQCINSESKPCCTDTITTNCEAMDSSCHWQCNTTEYGFCNGQGTDMYMKGFTVSGNGKDACVILLFKTWVLDTRTKFAFACVGVILLGIAIEGLLCLRREVQSRKILIRIRGLARRTSIVFLFALNIGSGYLAMLVAMTYSVELFFCMVIGLVVGHTIFNTEAEVGESVDPCCASQRESLIVKKDDCEVIIEQYQQEEEKCPNC